MLLAMFFGVVGSGGRRRALRDSGGFMEDSMAHSELRRGGIHTVAAIVRVWRGGWVVRVRCWKACS